MSSITGQDKIRGAGKECDVFWCAIVLRSVSVPTVTFVSDSVVVLLCLVVDCDVTVNPGHNGRPAP